MSDHSIRETFKNGVAVVGTGACTAIGTSAPMSAAAARAGIVRIREHPSWIDRAGEPMRIALSSQVPLEAPVPLRIVSLASQAAREAWSAFGAATAPLGRVPVFFGLPSERPGLTDEHGSLNASRLQEALAGELPVGKVEVFTTGHSAGLAALKAGADAIRRGHAELCLVGAGDSYISAETLEWLDTKALLKSFRNRWGRVPGEAAGCCLLASEQVLSRYRLTAKLRILSVSVTTEAPTANGVALGRGLTQVLREVTEGVPNGSKVQRIYCDMNGERSRAEEYGFTMTRITDRFEDMTAAWTPADCWGDVGAASGPLFAAMAVASAERRYAKGPLAVAWTSSDTGQKAAALFGLPVWEGRY